MFEVNSARGGILIEDFWLEHDPSVRSVEVGIYGYIPNSELRRAVTEEAYRELVHTLCQELEAHMTGAVVMNELLKSRPPARLGAIAQYLPKFLRAYL